MDAAQIAILFASGIYWATQFRGVQHVARHTRTRTRTRSTRS